MLYPQVNLTVINAGISRNSTVDGLKRLQKDVLDHKPDLVTVICRLRGGSPMKFRPVVRVLCLAFALGLAGELWVVDPASGAAAAGRCRIGSRPATKPSGTSPA